MTLFSELITSRGVIVAVSTVPMAIGQVAKHFGVRASQVRRLFTTGVLPEPDRVGAYRVFWAKDLPKIREALKRAGHLPHGGSG
jgi:hypothetical protein